LELALEGHFTEPHRFLVGHLLGHLDELERHVEELSSRIAERFRPVLDDARVKRLDAIPGVNRTMIEKVVAEIGADMSVYPDAAHLSSWAGICPGLAESAGQRLRSRAMWTNRWPRRSLATLPIVPERFELKPIEEKGARGQLAVVRRLLRSADEIIGATDAGREGELILRYILELTGCTRTPARRLWLS
jgi:transposase